MNNLLEPNTTWLVIRKRAYKMAGFDTDYRVEKETKNTQNNNLDSSGIIVHYPTISTINKRTVCK